jgi:hypothetical protein
VDTRFCARVMELVRHSATSFSSVLSVALLASGSTPRCWGATPPPQASVPFAKTIVAELLMEEKRIHDVPPSVSTLAERAVEAAAQAGSAISALPKDRETALRALQAMNNALARLNFLQPPREDLWVHTLGEALTPHPISDPNVQEGIADDRPRQPYIDRSQPFYWVECDMGSLFLIAAGERLGWDIRLAAVPLHNYVRWHLSGSEVINWDWTDGESYGDSHYRDEVSDAEHWAAVGIYTVSLSPDAMRGYYLGQIGDKYDQTPVGLGLLERALRLAPNDSATENNLAWAYVTNPGAASHWADALAYSLQALATDPSDANVIDTVACAFSANGETEIAASLERRAIEGARDATQQTSFPKHLAAITGKPPGLCPHG